MTRDETPSDHAAAALPEGKWAYACDDDELEEGEGPDLAVGYGSLLTLGAGIRKKQPLILIDPAEAENEARRIQFVAAQQMVAADDAHAAEGVEPADFLKDLAAFAPPPFADTDVPEADVPERADEQEGEAVVSDEPADAEAPADEVVVASEPSSNESEALVEPVECEMPGLAENEVTTAGIAEPERAEWHPPVTPPPVLAASSHSLRARMPARPPRRTFLDRLGAFLDRVFAWFR